MSKNSHSLDFATKQVLAIKLSQQLLKAAKEATEPAQLPDSHLLTLTISLRDLTSRSIQSEEASSPPVAPQEMTSPRKPLKHVDRLCELVRQLSDFDLAAMNALEAVEEAEIAELHNLMTAEAEAEEEKLEAAAALSKKYSVKASQKEKATLKA